MPSLSDAYREVRQARVRAWHLGFIITGLVFLVATLIIIMVTFYELDIRLPKQVDVVLTDFNNRGRWTQQYKLVCKHMPWVHAVHLYTSQDIGPQSWTLQYPVPLVTHTASDWTDLSNVSTQFIMLGDRVVPMRRIEKTYLYYRTTPRVFNTTSAPVISGHAEAFEHMYGLYNKDILARFSGSIRDYTFYLASTQQVSVREDLTRHLYVNADIESGSTMSIKGHEELQFKSLQDNPPYFVTIHVLGNDRATGDQWIVDWINGL